MYIAKKGVEELRVGELRGKADAHGSHYLRSLDSPTLTIPYSPPMMAGFPVGKSVNPETLRYYHVC
jgi:hypothetical protein